MQSTDKVTGLRIKMNKGQYEEQHRYSNHEKNVIIFAMNHSAMKV